MLSLKKLSGAQILGPPWSRKVTVPLGLSEEAHVAWEIFVLPGRLDSTSRRQGGSPHHILRIASGPDGHLAGQGDCEPADPYQYIMEQHQCKHLPSAHPARGCASPPRPPQTLVIPKILVNWKQTEIHKVCGLWSHIFWLRAFSSWSYLNKFMWNDKWNK